jgi:hypothetical protein
MVHEQSGAEEQAVSNAKKSRLQSYDDDASAPVLVDTYLKLQALQAALVVACASALSFCVGAEDIQLLC